MLRTVFLTLIICMSSFFAKAQFLERPLGLQTEGLIYTLAFGLYDTIHDLKSSKAEIDVENPSLKSINENAKYDIRYRLKDTQQNENSIVFIVPGFGSAHDNGVAPYLIEFFARKGLSSVALDSPANDRFIKRASYYGTPGIQQQDAKDLLLLIKTTLNWLEKNKKRKFDKINLIGTSLGGLNVSQVLLLAKEENFNFHRVIAINPPISNVYALNTIDHLVLNYHQKKKSVFEQQDLTWINRRDTFIKAFKQFIFKCFSFDRHPEKVLEVMRKNKISQAEAEYLIGFAFSGSVDRVSRGYWQRLTNDDYLAMPSELKHLKSFYQIFNAITLGQWQNSKNFRPSQTSEQADNLLLDSSQLDYKIPNLNSKLLKVLRNETQAEYLTREDDIRIEMDSILYNYQKLLTDEFKIMTWKDDLIINNELLTWLNENMNKNSDGSTSDRVKIYEKGGHLGGFYQTEFQNDLLNYLK